MLSYLKNIFGKKYFPLNSINIYKEDLLQNYHYLLSLQNGIAVAPVLKSNAYGHGIVEIAKILDDQNPPFFCVDSIYEAYELLKAKIKTPILIMGYVNPDNLKIKKLQFSYAVYDKKQLEKISKLQKNPKIHVKLDTGMHRLGVQIDELEDFITEIKKYKNVEVEGIMSHFAEASGKKFSNIQINNFKNALDIFIRNGIFPKWRHIGASIGLLNHNLHGVSNLVRVGKALYGTVDNKNLSPILEFTTTLVAIKKIKRGESVGYDRKFKAERDMTIGVLPVGYYDGVDRRLSDKGFVSIDNALCKITGLISMNITTIDLSNVKNPQIGQKVTIYSKNSRDLNSIVSASNLCETIPYEVLVHLISSTKRLIISPT